LKAPQLFGSVRFWLLNRFVFLNPKGLTRSGSLVVTRKICMKIS
jgi:hypothetical protein